MDFTTILRHRDWKSGMRIVDRDGQKALLLRETWGVFAWVIYDGQINPVTISVMGVKLDESDKATQDHAKEIDARLRFQGFN